MEFSRYSLFLLEKMFLCSLAQNYKQWSELMPEDMDLKHTLFINYPGIMVRRFSLPHNILLSRHKPHWLNYTIGPFKLSQLSEPKTYTYYFVNGVWILNGVAILFYWWLGIVGGNFNCKSMGIKWRSNMKQGHMTYP